MQQSSWHHPAAAAAQLFPRTDHPTTPHPPGPPPSITTSLVLCKQRGLGGGRSPYRRLGGSLVTHALPQAITFRGANNTRGPGLRRWQTLCPRAPGGLSTRALAPPNEASRWVPLREHVGKHWTRVPLRPHAVQQAAESGGSAGWVLLAWLALHDNT